MYAALNELAYYCTLTTLKRMYLNHEQLLYWIGNRESVLSDFLFERQINVLWYSSSALAAHIPITMKVQVIVNGFWSNQLMELL